jgi:DNA-binding NtrC family response regulator
VRAIKDGAIDFITKPWENQKLLATVRSAYQLRRSRLEIKRLRQNQKQLVESINRDFSIVKGASKAMQKVFETVEKVAGTDANILVTGENGTGKELIAREIHNKSYRKNEIFMRVDLGSLAEGLIESELFGHAKGAFTDAKEDRTGKLEAASGGTLFLDEIGNLSHASQSKLLTILQNRTVTPLGSNRNIAIDIRLISATNKDLIRMISEQAFRDDLYYRINTIHIEIPPLRNRKEDIPDMVIHFLRHYGDKYHKAGLRISGRTMKRLTEYSWPGNVRELQHAVEKAVILASSDLLMPDDFIPEKTIPIDTGGGNQILTLEKAEKQAISRTLQHCRGNLSKAAKMLKIGRQTLYNKMKKHGL